MSRCTSKWPRIVALGFLLAPQCAEAQQQNPAPSVPDNPLKEVLFELRALRQNLAHSLLLQSELLVSSEQVKLANQSLAAAAERLEGVRAQLALIEAGIRQARRTLEALDGQRMQTFDPESRAAVEQQLKEQRSLIAEQQQREGELREEEQRRQIELQGIQDSMQRAASAMQGVIRQIHQDAEMDTSRHSR